MSKFSGTLSFLILILTALPALAQAEDKKPSSGRAAGAPASPPASPTGTGAEQVNVDAIKEKYWARGEEAELGVVQNRLYSKERKFEFGTYGGFLSTDPFLTVTSVGGSFGFHFTEYVSLHVFGWKSFVGKSTAFDGFQEATERAGGAPAVPNTNYPTYYYGIEPSWSLLYGKLSVVGKAIIYYDFHLLGGLGITGTEFKPLFTPHIGVGQQIFLSKLASLRVDYRIMHYTEQLIKKRDPREAPIANEGLPIDGERSNWTHAITVGVSFLFGIGL
jgi:outer membrane beta-barrel protein